MWIDDGVSVWMCDRCGACRGVNVVMNAECHIATVTAVTVLVAISAITN